MIFIPNYAAIVTRDYGMGRVLIHSDKIDAYQTGHHQNPIAFWRHVLEYVSHKTYSETIKVGLIVNDVSKALEKMSSFALVDVEELTISDIALRDISGFDCLYFVGLPSLVHSTIATKIAQYVLNGGGMIIESPNRSGEINVLSGIESVSCSSIQRPVETNAFWTMAGKSHYIYDPYVTFSFMTTLISQDFSNWSCLMSNVVSQTDKLDNQQLDVFTYSGSSTFEIGISFYSSMQNGIVVVKPGIDTMSSSSSSSSMDSSSSSSSYSQSSSSSSIDSSSSSSSSSKDSSSSSSSKDSSSSSSSS